MKSRTFLILAFLSLNNEELLKNEVAASVTELISEFNPQTSRECAVLSIGAPELMRYSLVSDFLETEILEIAYAEYGLDYADFSIGKFQMKPSFVERLEQSICENPELYFWYQELTTYSVPDDQAVRTERIRRIKSPNYQYLILSAFYDYCRLTYCEYLESVNIEKEVGFIGTAYNMGFNKSSNEILKYQSLKRFPFGARYKGDQYAYSSVSTEIFKQLIKSLCKSSFTT